MKELNVSTKGILITLVVSAIVLGLVFISLGLWLNTSTSLVPLGTQACYTALNSTNINFGTLSPAGTSPSDHAVVDTNYGNAPANVLIEGTNWESSASNFTVESTFWSDIPSSTATIGHSLNLPPYQATGIGVLGNSTVKIFFGLSVPSETPAGTYTQGIFIENIC